MIIPRPVQIDAMRIWLAERTVIEYVILVPHINFRASFPIKIER